VRGDSKKSVACGQTKLASPCRPDIEVPQNVTDCQSYITSVGSYVRFHCLGSPLSTEKATRRKRERFHVSLAPAKIGVGHVPGSTERRCSSSCEAPGTTRIARREPPKAETVRKRADRR
jgi:hypothetical protein